MAAGILKNSSGKVIGGYVLACFARKGGRYQSILEFDPTIERIDPGGFTGVVGFDATPANVCTSRSASLGVARVDYADGSSWSSPLMQRVPNEQR